MNQSLKEIEYLSRSENRVQVLKSLMQDALTRRELQEKTGASQATLSRILQDFEERQWIRKQGAVYEATVFGSWVADCVGELQVALSASDKLEAFEPWLPTDIERFDVRWLADAEVITPTETEPNAPMDRVQSVLRAAQHIRVLSYAYNKNCLDASVTAVRERGQQYEGVYSTGAIQSLREKSKWHDQLETMLEADTTAISVYEGEVPCSVEIADEVVHLILRDDQGVVRAVIESESIPLRNWAVSLFERYLADAESIDT
jgi:predicted transcriptional regulator